LKIISKYKNKRVLKFLQKLTKTQERIPLAGKKKKTVVHLPLPKSMIYLGFY
jgi:hypothetical protein